MERNTIAHTVEEELAGDLDALHVDTCTSTSSGIRTKLESLKTDLAPDRRHRGCISGYVIVCNKMAWNGKHPLESASKSLLENFEFFAYACL